MEVADRSKAGRDREYAGSRYLEDELTSEEAIHYLRQIESDERLEKVSSRQAILDTTHPLAGLITLMLRSKIMLERPLMQDSIP